MIINSTVYNYLTGAELSNDSNFSIGARPMIKRNTLLVDLVKDKTVLHVGCSDHSSLIKKKRDKNNYLHDLLGDSAKTLFGIDTNIRALAEMRSIGIRNLYHVDDIPTEIHFDLILIPDVIEHVANVKQFLIGLKRYSAKELRKR